MRKLKKLLMAVCLPVALVLMAAAVKPTTIKAAGMTSTINMVRPNTGDDSSMTLFIVLLGVSFVGVAVILIVNLTKKKNKKKSDQKEKNQQHAD